MVRRNLAGAVTLSLLFMMTVLSTTSEAAGLYSWGRNAEGQLGTGDTVEHHLPWPVSLSNVIAVAAGTQHSLVLLSNGDVYAWGSNSAGQLGLGGGGDRTSPTKISTLSNTIGIDAWANRSFAIRNDGTLWAWGENGTGALGDGTTTNRDVPTQVLTNVSPQQVLTDVKCVSTGLRHTLAVRTDGTVWAWGNNAVGQFGDGTTFDSHVAFQVPGLSGINKVSAGEMHSLALTNDGGVLAWGSNSYGQVGVDTTENYYADPWPVNGLSTGVYWICAGYSHGVALKSNGTVWTWGRNSSGQLGDGSWTDRRAPVQVSGLTDVTQISHHCFYHVHAVVSSGAIYGWGSNSRGQIGNGMTTNYNTPHQVSDFLMTGPSYGIVGGHEHALALGQEPATVQVTIASSPVGRTVNVDGQNHVAPAAFTWLQGSSHQVSVSSPQAVGDDTKYVFDNWSDGGAQDHTCTVGSSNDTITANFRTEYRLRMNTPVGPGGVSPAIGDHWYTEGAIENVAATPDEPVYGFLHWMVNGSPDDHNPHGITIDGPYEITAHFAPYCTVNIQTSPATDLGIRIDGVAYAAPQTRSWVEGSAHEIAVDGQTQRDGQETRYAYLNWSDGGQATHDITVPVGGGTYTADFKEQYRLDTNVVPGGAGSVGLNPDAGDDYYDTGTDVIITATRNTGYQFSDWGGVHAGKPNPFTLTMNTPMQVWAYFDQKLVDVTVQTNPAGEGLLFTVDGNPTTYTSNVFTTWQEGSTHTLSVVPDQKESGGQRYHFTTWSDGNSSASRPYIVPGSPDVVTASFGVQYQLSAAVNPSGAGTVTPPDGSWHDANDVISVSASANPAYAFDQWSGDLSGSSSTESLTMNAPKAVTANFVDAVAVNSFTANPGIIGVAGSSTLSWSTSNATSCSIDNGIGSVADSGSTDVSPAATTTYTLTADGPGGPATAQVTVTVDGTSPTVTITSPTSGSTHTTDAWTVDIAGTASDNVGLAGVAWSNAATGEDNPCNGTDNWSANGINLAPGDNVITITATDSAGSTDTDTLTVTCTAVDSVPPMVTIAVPADDPFGTSDQTLYIEGTASDDKGLVSVTWQNDRGGNGECAGTNSWSYDGIWLFAGTNVITVTAHDVGSNTAVDTVTVDYTDATPPVVTITEPTVDPTWYSPSSPLGVRGTASDNVGISTITWSNDRGGNGDCTFDGANWWTGQVDLQSGPNVITIDANDAANNVATDAITVILDTTSPQVTITVPTPDPTYAAVTSTLDIGGTASDNEVLAQVQWRNVTTGDSGICSGTASWSQPGIALIPGENEITAQASDAAGNRSFDTLIVTYVPANTPPTITSTALAKAYVGVEYAYTITATGNPLPAVTVDEPSLPAWLTWAAATNTLSGTPGPGDAGIPVPITATASNGIAPDDTQDFTIEVAELDPALVGWWRLDETAGMTAIIPPAGGHRPVVKWHHAWL